MTKILVYVALMIVASMSAMAQYNPVDIAFPKIGTRNGGEAYEGACAPFGIVLASPMRDHDWSYDIDGIGILNLSGTGCNRGALGTPRVVAYVGDTLPARDKRKITIWEPTEVIRPGSYSVQQKDGDIKYEVASTQRAAVLRISFPVSSEHKQIIIDPCNGLVKSTGGEVRLISDTEMSGHVQAGGFCSQPHSYDIYFYARVLDASETRILSGGEVTAEPVAIGSDVMGSFVFKPSLTSTTIAIGISFTSVEHARKNLEAEVPDVSFEAVKQATEAKWHTVLSKIIPYGGTDDDRKMFVSALYRCFQSPSVFTEVSGATFDANGNPTQDSNFTRRTFLSPWDNVWTNWPLLTLISPNDAQDIFRTMLARGNECGILPQWEYLGDETFIMGGDPSPVFVHQMMNAGLATNEELERIYQIMHHTALDSNRVRPVQRLLNTFHFVPIDGTGDWDRRTSSVSLTMEYTLADWHLGNIAAKLGKPEDKLFFHDRSMWIKNMFDDSFGMFRPKHATSVWYSPFDPDTHDGNEDWAYSGGPGFKENSAREWLFYPLHVVDWLAGKLGGVSSCLKELDFGIEKTKYKPVNQPLFQHPWMYTLFPGHEWRAYPIVKKMVSTSFNATHIGLPGNDDLGSTSGWLVWSMMGVYPITDGTGKYRLGACMFDSVQINVERADGTTHPLMIRRIDSGLGTDRYASFVVTPSGNEKRAYITHDELFTASILHLQDTTTLDVEESSIPSATVYPLPANEVLKFSFPDQADRTIRIINSLGMECAVHVAVDIESIIDVRYLVPGSYVAMVTKGNTVERIPVVIIH